MSDLVAGRWTIDPAHSEVTFAVRHLMTTVRGSFTEFTGEILVREFKRRRGFVPFSPWAWVT